MCLCHVRTVIVCYGCGSKEEIIRVRPVAGEGGRFEGFDRTTYPDLNFGPGNNAIFFVLYKNVVFSV